MKRWNNLRKRPRSRGVAYVELAFLMVVFIPLMLGVIACGLNMHLQLQTVQLARDAGHMFARYIDFTLLGNQQVLASVSGTLGLSTTAGSGNAVVILSTVRYVDVGACKLAGKVDASGNPSGCTNYQSWVFSKRLVIGKSALRSSNLGTPSSSIIATDGSISITNQVTASSAVATITGINPWNSTNSTGLPNGQIVYVAEASATGFHMPPFTNGTQTYAQIYF
jgi:hypothetical protein